MINKIEDLIKAEKSYKIFKKSFNELIKQGKSSAEAFDHIIRLKELSGNFTSKNKIELTPDIDVDDILLKIKEKYRNEEINDTDGVKIDFEKEWVHLRKSNTEPIIRIYSESRSAGRANALAGEIIQEIRRIAGISGK